ncbi:hypothetical protein BGZ73_003734 [Actinomortierella ambigua]|nr:hypothetical protein BGZ73_003734 [Actinomortierella ambigua]
MNAFLLLSSPKSYGDGMSACHSLSEVVPGLLGNCLALNKRSGDVSRLPCTTKLPTLCYNSAPRHVYPLTDTSRRIQIETPVGPMVGWRDQNTFRFLGIPYAEPPVGELRWAKLVPKWHVSKTQCDCAKNKNRNKNSSSNNITSHQVWEAINFGNVCPQTPRGLFPEIASRLLNGASDSEDCLYLNVFTPSLKPTPPSRAAATRGLPVMVYLHGSMFTQYGSSLPIFDPGHLVARGGVVVVTFNYRLRFFGLLRTTTNSTAGSSHPEADGNQAIHDQILALTRVRDNIASFWRPLSFSTALACARKKSVAEILDAQMQATGQLRAEHREDSLRYESSGSSGNSTTADGHQRWWTSHGVFHRPIIDGNLLSDEFHALVDAGKINPKARILWGNTVDDAGYFSSLFWQDPVPLDKAEASLKTSLPPDRVSDIFAASQKFMPLDRLGKDAVRVVASWYGTRALWFCPLRYLSRRIMAKTASLDSCPASPSSRATSSTTSSSSSSSSASATRRTKHKTPQSNHASLPPIYFYRFHYGRNLPSASGFCAGSATSAPRVCHASDI